jgi:transcription elongation GreA/GreB family factor
MNPPDQLVTDLKKTEKKIEEAERHMLEELTAERRRLKEQESSITKRIREIDLMMTSVRK